MHGLYSAMLARFGSMEVVWDFLKKASIPTTHTFVRSVEPIFTNSASRLMGESIFLDDNSYTNVYRRQKYSSYLPLQNKNSTHTSPERSQSSSTSRKGKGSKPKQSAEALAQKRRSTMNSRDAAYDEGEQLRRAIEESKKLGVVLSVEGSRRNKRSRSDSDEYVFLTPLHLDAFNSFYSALVFEIMLIPWSSELEQTPNAFAQLLILPHTLLKSHNFLLHLPLTKRSPVDSSTTTLRKFVGQQLGINANENFVISVSEKD